MDYFRLVEKAANHLVKQQSLGKPQYEAWNSSHIYLTKAAEVVFSKCLVNLKIKSEHGVLEYVCLYVWIFVIVAGM